VSDRAPYSRIYWAIIDDAKFATIYDDDGHLATWLRLLLIADQAWPASAHLPSTARRRSVAELARVGVIDLLPGSRYRIHGLDPERERRGREQTNGGAVRAATAERDEQGRFLPSSDGATAGPALVAIGGSPATQLRRDEPRRDETSLDAGLDGWDVFETYYSLTNRFPSKGSRLRDWLYTIGERFGQQRASQMIAAKFRESSDLSTLLGRVDSALAAEAHAADKAERAAETKRNAAKRAPLDPFQRELYEALLKREQEGAA
jgi:hypothetical protein